ncbi:MAG: class I SAM-dependent methyltransferase [Chloroflexota bacterium]
MDFYLEMARRLSGPFLDVGCGTGRVALAMAEHGYEAMGLDSSESMLAIGLSKAAGRIELVRADMRSFDLGRRFALAAITLNAFMHLLEIEDQIRALRCVAGHLAPGGRAVISAINPYSMSLQDSESKLIHEFTRPDPAAGSTVTKLSAREVDAADQIERVTYIYDEATDGRVCRTTTVLDFRYTYRFELELLARQAGLEPIAVYGSYDLDSYEVTSDTLICVCRRATDAA